MFVKCQNPSIPKGTTMYRTLFNTLCSLLLASAAVSYAADSTAVPAPQTIISPKSSAVARQPQVVIYTLSTCPHCREAKEYFTSNNIPFINREVDSDDAQMEMLMKIYDSMGVPESKRGVPLIVIDDRIRLQGFNKDKFQSLLKEAAATHK